MTRTATSSARAVAHLHLVPPTVSAPVVVPAPIATTTTSPSPALSPLAPVVPLPSATPVRPRTASRRPLMERLRPHLPCRSDATELRHTLAALGPDWRLVRGLTDDGVHSLLVGPGGVFALTVQSLAHARIAVAGTTVTVDGKAVPLIPQRRLVADNLGRRISTSVGSDIRVRSLVAIIHAQPKWSFREQPADGRVTVLPGRDVAAFLAAQAPVLTADDVEAITRAAVSPGRPARPVLYAV